MAKKKKEAEVNNSYKRCSVCKTYYIVYKDHKTSRESVKCRDCNK